MIGNIVVGLYVLVFAVALITVSLDIYEEGL